jgi:glycosyltransferase involved in cell wall biosynthesis
MEPAPIVLQEAMSAGLPVVASDVCGAAYELITDGVSGRVFKTGDVNSLRDALEDMTHPDHLEAYTEQAQSAFRQWRREAYPIPEVRRALSDVGVLSSAKHDRDRSKVHDACK